MNCPTCHSPLEPGKKFCGKCGAKIGSVARPAAVPKGDTPRISPNPPASQSPVSPAQVKEEADKNDSDYGLFALGFFVTVAWLLGHIFHAGPFIDAAPIFAVIFYLLPWSPERRLIRQRQQNSEFLNERDYSIAITFIFVLAWLIGLPCHASLAFWKAGGAVVLFDVAMWLTKPRAPSKGAHK